jgi:hypothetical protein
VAGGGDEAGGGGIRRVACRRRFHNDGKCTRNSQQLGNARKWCEQLQNPDSPSPVQGEVADRILGFNKIFIRPDSWFQLDIHPLVAHTLPGYHLFIFFREKLQFGL